MLLKTLPLQASFSLWNVLWMSILIIAFGYLKVRSESQFVKRRLRKYLFLRNLKPVYKPTIVKYFPFYDQLDQKGKKLFEKRVQKFIDIKTFIPRGGMESVTPEMKAMIAGSAVQLTFGYPDVYFRYFWRILVYPDDYYSTITKKYHKGEVNIKGLIVLSWKSFKGGFLDSSDGRNLGIHEMAHALRLINIVRNEEYDFYDRIIMKKFEEEANNETIKLLNSADSVSLFRRYSATNIDEFFSVAVECFFERPVDFKNYNPGLYFLLTKILKLDPAELYSRNQSKNLAS